MAPDLVYAYGGVELLVEITAAYYDSEHAEFLWKGAKNSPDAPTGWSGTNPDKNLAAAIATCIAKKSQKRYGPNTVLLIEVPPGTTTVERLEALLQSHIGMTSSVFVAIYVVGAFPMSTDSMGGYRVISLQPLPQ